MRFTGNAESPHDSEIFKTATRGTKFQDETLQGKPETKTIGGLDLHSAHRGWDGAARRSGLTRTGALFKKKKKKLLPASDNEHGTEFCSWWNCCPPCRQNNNHHALKTEQAE